MKKTISLIALSALFVACNQRPSTDELITIDVEATYPEKKLMLQDFADVEYVPLETTDEFINKGMVRAIGQKFILVDNGGNEGTIFLYDRQTGKGIRTINRKGQSGEEYASYSEIILDEEQNEIFVVAYSQQKILVYDLEGNYSRSFKFAENSLYNFTFNYDKNHLLTYKGYPPLQESEKSGHILISKQDGGITREFNFPYQEIKTPIYTGMHEKYGEVTVTPFYNLTIHGSREDWFLTRPSSDTLYHCLSDGSVSPYLVRTPAIHNMNPEIFLFPCMVTHRYTFLHALEKKVNKSRLSYPSAIQLGYDKEEKAIYQYSFYNADYPDKEVSFSFWTSLQKDVMMYQTIQASELTEAYQEGKLQGKLKEIASTLDEDSNVVLVLMKYNKQK